LKIWPCTMTYCLRIYTSLCMLQICMLIFYFCFEKGMNLTGVSTVRGVGHAPTLTILTKSVTGLYLFQISPASAYDRDDMCITATMNKLRHVFTNVMTSCLHFFTPIDL
jgi:hypothetical protein